LGFNEGPEKGGLIYRRLKSKASDPSSKELEVESPDSRVLLAELFRNKGGAK
jgi:hypothetical protein